MRILVFGAGAIGSLFGAKLSKYNDVTLLGREEHIQKIRERGLVIRGKTRAIFHLNAISRLEDYKTEPDIVMIAVKSYDTDIALKNIIDYFGKDICVMSLQNGLDNVEKMRKLFDEEKIIIGLTTEASLFLKPGEIEHTGKGKTTIGSLKNTRFLEQLYQEFVKAGFETRISNNIERDVWRKAIVNACINPLTAIFGIRNGVLKNKVLSEIVRDICRESIEVARGAGIEIDYEDMLGEIWEVIDSTSENFSSMLQSIIKGRKTEIDSINGYIYNLGKKVGVEAKINKLLTELVKIREEFK